MRSGRTQPCDRAQARTRLNHAEKSLEVAELVAGERAIPESRSVAAALAILSGIAASDAACAATITARRRRFYGRSKTALGPRRRCSTCSI